jgi:hypothetical protein
MVLLVVLTVSVLITSIVPPPLADPLPHNVGPTGEAQKLLVDEAHVVAGSESWGSVEVMPTGTLIVPEGAVLRCNDVTLHAGSELLLEGGDMYVFNREDEREVGLAGMCQYLTITDGSRLVLEGTSGGPSLADSIGCDVTLDVEASERIWIENAEILLTAGKGNSPPDPYTGGGVQGRASAGGHATLDLTAHLSKGTLHIANSTVTVEAGDGGDAPDGKSPVAMFGGFGGGFSSGGWVRGEVGRGGDAWMTLSAMTLTLNDNDMAAIAGRGGNAGDGGQTSSPIDGGAGGGGYSGGHGGDADGSGSSPGGEVSGEVGRGGDSVLRVIAFDMSQTRSDFLVRAGSGGGAGNGGHAVGHGGGGGGGYSGGGGGSKPGSDGADGGRVLGEVGSGGDATANAIVERTMWVEDSAYSVSAGRGGDAGYGGTATAMSGAGGGGYSAGGGAGEGAETFYNMMGGDGGSVTGEVATGGDASLVIDSPEAILFNTSLRSRAGAGGEGGIAGYTNLDSHKGEVYGGGGGGSYSSGGGGGCSAWPRSYGLGGDGGIVSGWVGDGGDSELLLKCYEPPTIRDDCSITATRGSKGFCWRSTAYRPTGGEGAGRITSKGEVVKSIPVSKPRLLFPFIGFESADVPLFEWTMVHGSTFHGGVVGYNLMMDDEEDFSNPEVLTTVANGTLRLWQLVKGDLYWKVRAVYGRPPQHFGPWSDTASFVHTNSPPRVDLIDTINVTIREPRTIDLAPYINDTDDDHYSLAVTMNHWAIQYHSHMTFTVRYDTWVPDHRIYFNVSDQLARTRGFVQIHVIDYNTDPVILGVGEQNPPILIQLDEGEEFSAKVRTYDKDGDGLTIELINPGPRMRILDGDMLNIVAEQGVVGEFRPTIVASDGRGGQDSIFLIVRIGDIAEPPEIPVFTSPKNGTRVDKGTFVVFAVDLEDPDFAWGDTDRLTVISNISGILTTVDTSTDVEFATAGLAAGRHRITAIVEDGNFTTRGHIIVTVVGEPEKPPVWGPSDELWLVVGFIVISLVMLVMGYYVGIRRARRRQRMTY